MEMCYEGKYYFVLNFTAKKSLVISAHENVISTEKGSVSKYIIRQITKIIIYKVDANVTWRNGHLEGF